MRSMVYGGAVASPEKWLIKIWIHYIRETENNIHEISLEFELAVESLAGALVSVPGGRWRKPA